jgi:putative hydrolase of the HAD superfamily
VNWIVFDYGEVISTRTQAIPELAATMGVEPSIFEAHYWAQREPYDRGLSDFQYWKSIADAAGVSLDQSTSDKLTSMDIEGWLNTDPETVEMLAALDEAGAALALLSNAPSSFARVAERQDWAKHFRVTVFSGDLGYAKPDPEIFATLVAKLDATAPSTSAADCLFLDDRQVNVDGAVAAGLRSQRWLGAGQTPLGEL